VRDDLGDLVAEELERRGGLDAAVDAVVERETDPYTLADEVVEPIADCLEEREGGA
jgi:LAO/AO transport system kinase